MLVNSKHFGEIEIAEGDIFLFENGLPGFSELTKFALLKMFPEEDDSLYCLQSLEEENVAFVLIDAFKIFADYNPIVNDEDVKCLGELGNDLVILNILNVKDDVKDMTVNLLAPVVINTATQKGCQAIVSNEGYKVKHPFPKHSAENN